MPLLKNSFVVRNARKAATGFCVQTVYFFVKAFICEILYFILVIVSILYIQNEE